MQQINNAGFVSSVLSCWFYDTQQYFYHFKRYSMQFIADLAVPQEIQCYGGRAQNLRPLKARTP